MIIITSLRFQYLKLSNTNLLNHYKTFSYTACKLFTNSNTIKFVKQSNVSNKHLQILYPSINKYLIDIDRNYSKKKKSSKKFVEDDQESDSDDEEYEDIESEEPEDADSIVTKRVASMRLDTVAKAAFGMSKKTIEKEFYASNFRVNGEKVLKKSTNVNEGDEIDLVKYVSPDNKKFLIVNRLVLKSVGKPTGAGNYPVRMQVFKSLTIENYADPWGRSTDNLE